MLKRYITLFENKYLYEEVNMDMAIPNYYDTTSKFRQWITNTWYEHKREVLSWDKKVVDYSQEEWFAKNKWFLKRQYRGKN